MVKKGLVITIVFLFLVSVSGCFARTKISYQELPQVSLTKKINNVELGVVRFGVTKNWSELEIKIANFQDKPLNVVMKKVYLLSERGYYLPPYTEGEISDKIESKIGKLVNPITLAALATGVAAIVLPYKGDRANLWRATGVLVGGALAHEGIKREKAGKDKTYSKDFGLQDKEIPQKLTMGGIIYYPPIKEAKGIKAYITIDGREEIFEINF